MSTTSVQTPISNAGPSKWLALTQTLGMTAGFFLITIVVVNLLFLGLSGLGMGVRTWNPEHKAMAFATGSALGEFLGVYLLWAFLHRRGDGFRRLGLRWTWSWFAWLAALVLAGKSLHDAIGSSHMGAATTFFDPSFYHIYTAIVIACSAAFCEEVVYRGFVMTRLADAGISRIVQVIASGFLFAAAHAGYGFMLGWRVGLGIMIPTGIMGMEFAVVYLLGRRSLIPGMVWHFLNDAALMPWVLLTMMRMRIH